MDQVKKMVLIDPRMYERLNSANGDIRVKSIMDKMTNANRYGTLFFGYGHVEYFVRSVHDRR